MRPRCFRLASWLVVMGVAGTLFVGQPQSAVAGQISLGQVDNFQSGTLSSWANANAPDPLNVTTGGPAGAGDRFLQVSSGTLGGGSRLIVFNQNQWDGNFISAGVTAIGMDLENFGSQTLPMRIALRLTAGGNSQTPSYASTTPFNLPADGQWHHAVFRIDSSNLTPVHSPTTLSTFLTSVGEFRILSSTAPAEIGDAITGRFGVDNITAVPEPTSLLLVILSLGLFALPRRD